MNSKFFSFLFLITILSKYKIGGQKIKCQIADDPDVEYSCHLTINNTIDLKSALRSTKIHLPNKNDIDVKELHFTSLSYSKDQLPIVCQKFANLQILEAEFVEIRSLDENLIDHCKKLKLFLLKNGPEEIPENLISEQSLLIFLAFIGGKFKSLPENLFQNQRNVQELEIMNGMLEILPSNIFRPLENVNWIKLSGNKINILNPAWFIGLEILEHLDLSNNRINDLPKGIFAPLKNLSSLNLSSNNLTVIHSDSFGVHKSLQSIYVSYNKINAIDGKLFDDSTQHPFFIFQENRKCIDGSGVEQSVSSINKDWVRKCFGEYLSREEE